MARPEVKAPRAESQTVLLANLKRTGTPPDGPEPIPTAG